MGYFGNLMNALMARNSSSQTFDISKNLTDDEVREFIRIGGGMQSISGRVVNEKESMKVAAANRCVQIVSSVVACMPTDLVRRVDENTREPAEGHSLRRLLTVRPNGMQTPKQFKQLMMVWLLLRGNAYALKVKSGDDIVALMPLEPSRMRVELTNAGRKIFIYTNDRGQEVRYSSEQMFHLCGLSLDGVMGISVLSYMREAIALALDGEGAASHMMKNGTFADIALKFPNKLSKEAADRLKESWADRREGIENTGRTPVIEEGGDIIKLSMTAGDLQFLQQRDFQRYDIAMFFGVPPHMIGATEKTTSWGSGIESLNIGFVTYTINDWLVTWQETVKRDLMSERDAENHDFRFFTHGLLKGDVKAQWQAFTQGRQWGIFSPNDVRALLDMNPRTDPEGDEYAVPPNQTKDETDDEEVDPETEE